jgi:hypothetical protein
MQVWHTPSPRSLADPIQISIPLAIVSLCMHKVSLTLFLPGKTRHFLCFIRPCCNTAVTRRACDGHFSCGK